MSFWSSVSDFIFKVTWEKVMLFVVFLMFWLVGYALIPVGVSEYLFEKIPSFLPFRITSVDVAVLVFTLLVSLIVYFLIQLIKKMVVWTNKPKSL